MDRFTRGVAALLAGAAVAIGWGDGVVFIRVEPDVMFAYAFHPERFPDLD